MTELTLHAGGTGESLTLNVDWTDHNNIFHCNTIVIRIPFQDKPRILEILIDGILAERIDSNKPFFPVKTRKEPILPAEWQYHEMLRHGAQPNTQLFGMMDGPFETPVDDAVAAWNRRRVGEPDAVMPRSILPPNYVRPWPMPKLASDCLYPHCNEQTCICQKNQTAFIDLSEYVDAGMA